MATSSRTIEHDTFKNVLMEEIFNEKQDSQFDQILGRIKPFTLNLSQKLERQRVAQWIKKLCETEDLTTSGRKNRNLYAQLLLHMLQRGILEGPFSVNPDPGHLPTLPSYMSIYFEDPNRSVSASPSPEKINTRPTPDWVIDELAVNYAIPNNRSLGKNPVDSSPPPVSGSRISYIDNQYDDMNYRRTPIIKTSLGTKLQDASGSPTSARGRNFNTSLISESQHYRHNTGKSKALLLQTEERELKRLQEKELEVKMKAVESKYHEEKLKLQQKHDSEVQKILDRKNTEIEEVKAHFRSKFADMESTIKRLERKVSKVLQESSQALEQRDKQILELKSLSIQTSQSVHNDYERKLHDTVAKHEQEKFDMQKKNTESIQDLLEDTNKRIQKMENEYKAQLIQQNNINKELEDRIQQESHELEAVNAVRLRLSSEKLDIEQKFNETFSELRHYKSICDRLEQDQRRTAEEHESELQQTQKKFESLQEYKKQEFALAEAKATETITGLEDTIDQLKQRLQDTENRYQRDYKELQIKYQNDKSHTEQVYESKIQTMQNQIEQQRIDAQKNYQKLEGDIREREEQLKRLSEQQRMQTEEAERTLEEFKIQMENHSEQIFDEMKKQMATVEQDLERSKLAREKQKEEYKKQLEERRRRYETEMAELRASCEQDKLQLMREGHKEKDKLMREMEREKEVIAEKFRKALSEQEAKAADCASRDSKTINDLEKQVSKLRENLIQANSAHKAQLVELGLLREDEKQAAIRAQEAATNKLQSQMEQEKLKLQQDHSNEMEKLLQNTNNRLNQIDTEYKDQTRIATEKIEMLQNQAYAWKEENSNLQNEHNKQLAEIYGNNQKDIEDVKKRHSCIVKSLKDEINNQKSNIQLLEKQSLQKEREFKEKISRLQLQYEDRIKDMISAEMKEELEDTIRSLKSQVNMLQQKTTILQDELTIKTYAAPLRLDTSLASLSNSPRQ